MITEDKMNRKALGRGIDALIGKIETGKETITKIPLDKIVPNKYQPRKNFDENSIKELAQSIKENGLAQPILVTRIPGEDKYEIIAGERRYRACKFLNWKEIDAIVKNEIDDEKKLIIALIENLQREDLNPVEKANAYKKMLDFGMSQTEISNYCGKSKYYVSNTLRLLELEDEILNGLANGLITEGHARALLSIPDREERKKAYQKIISEKLSVRDIENYSKRFYKETSKKNKKTTKTPEIYEMEKYFESKLGTKVEIKPTNQKSGKIIINYFSLEDFDRIKNKLTQ